MDLLVIILSIPKTVYVNFRYLPFRQACKLPIWTHYNTKIAIKGKILVPDDCSLATIRIGFHKVPICDNAPTVVSADKGGIIKFLGTAHIGYGSKIAVHGGGELILGDNFAISAATQISCYRRIRFGRDIQFSWDCLVMDSDSHKIYDEQDVLMNPSREIVFGNKIWIGCRSTVLKGVVIPDNCVVGSCSLVTGGSKGFVANSIIAGNPARSIKKINKWEL